MNGIGNENHSTIVKQYEFDKTPIHNIDSRTDKCISDCHKKKFSYVRI